MKRHIPNILTCFNLLCGSIATILIINDKVVIAGIFLGCSLLFDFLDGFAARAFKANSEIGKQLDSLADMVSFGLVPGLIGSHLCLKSPPMSLEPEHIPFMVIGYFPLIITIASAIRLARFNLDTRQTDSFIGVPTPAVTIFMMGLALVIEHDRFNLTPTILNPWFVCGLSMILAWLLNSELPMLALKFKSFSIKDNAAQYALIASCVFSLVFFGIAGIPLTIILYILTSIFNSSKAINN
jgi:CDP-diacylglycerol---serine O-phosphatidyltransferase